MKELPLDRRIEIYREAELGRDKLNASIKGPVLFARLWAGKGDVSDGERVRAMEVGATVTARFQVRWSQKTATISTKDTLRFKGQDHDITGVKELGRRRRVEITATRRAEAGTP